MNTQELKLKEVYEGLFKIGAACEHLHDHNPNNEIGNPDKEKLIAKHFNSITFANELKPLYNMGFTSPDAKEDYLPFVINPNARKMLDWAKANGIKVRGHVMVWHSQCPKEVFCKSYTPITFPTDPEELKEKPFLKNFEKLNPVCFVDRDTMLKRLKSYIFSLVEYMYANGFASTIYAWDVVNEAIELADKTPTGLRNTYWYQVIGEDFIYWAFRYAHDAVNEMAVKYAAEYKVNPANQSELKTIIPLLFYNDYNEMDPEKKKAIIEALTHETNEHGSVVSEQLLDGIGMQGHISDNNNIDQYIEALNDYSKYAGHIHITELDVKCTCTNVNAFYYQAVFYQKLFEALISAKKAGANLSSVTLWGLTDDNSWIHGANPLLFNADLTSKKSFDALVYAVRGGSLGEPEPVHYDLSDRLYDFESTSDGNPYEPKENGFKMIGFGDFEVQSKEVHSGNCALGCEKRFGGWSFIGLDISDFIGQTIDIDVWVKSPASQVVLKSDGLMPPGDLVGQATTDGQWARITTRYKVPYGPHSMFLRFETVETTPDVFSPVYVDDLSIKLVGLEESFESSSHIAAIRGAGHLPVLFVTDKESVDGQSHSLCVTRHEKDATVKFDISPYIGSTITISAFVKTKDSAVRMGLELNKSVELAEVATQDGGWTKISAVTTLSNDLKSAEFYLETDGANDMFIDDIFVGMAE